MDRKALPWPLGMTGPEEESLTGTAAWLADRWTEQLGPLVFTADSDFFELGGTSLAAAKLVSLCGRASRRGRRRVRTPTAGSSSPSGSTRWSRGGARSPARGDQRRGGRAVQLAGVLLLLTFAVPRGSGGSRLNRSGPGLALGWRGGWLIVGWLVFTSAAGRAVIVAAARRLLLAGLKPGRYPRHSWLTFADLVRRAAGRGARVNRVGRDAVGDKAGEAPGRRVGAGVSWHAPESRVAIRVGEGATLEPDVDLHGWWIDGHELVVGELKIGRGARVGTRSVLMPGADIGAGAEVEPGQRRHAHVPAGERWAGRRRAAWASRWDVAAKAPPRAAAPVLEGHVQRWAAASMRPAAAAIPGLVLMEALDRSPPRSWETAKSMAIGAPLLAASFVVGEAVLIALVVRLVSRASSRAGTGHGRVAWALWFGEQVSENTRALLFPLYATLYTRGWLRLHGISVGKRTEVSTAHGLNPLVTMGETTFVADASCSRPLVVPRVAAGRADRCGQPNVPRQRSTAHRRNDRRRRQSRRGRVHRAAARPGWNVVVGRAAARAAACSRAHRPVAHDRSAPVARPRARGDGARRVCCPPRSRSCWPRSSSWRSTRSAPPPAPLFSWRPPRLWCSPPPCARCCSRSP